MLKDFVRGNLAVEQEYTTLLERTEHVIAPNVGGVVTGNKVGMVDEPGHIQRTLAEAKVADGDTAALLGVVGEVSLCIEIGVVADDLDGVLVCSDGTVRTKTPEHAGNDTSGRDVDRLTHRDGATGHVVIDTDGEVAECLACKVIIDSLCMGGSEVLAGETEAATDDLHVSPAHLAESGDDILVEGLTE